MRSKRRRTLTLFSIGSVQASKASCGPGPGTREDDRRGLAYPMPLLSNPQPKRHLCGCTAWGKSAHSRPQLPDCVTRLSGTSLHSPGMGNDYLRLPSTGPSFRLTPRFLQPQTTHAQPSVPRLMQLFVLAAPISNHLTSH
jgi:hypothetical protein